MWESKQRCNFYLIFPLHSTPLHCTELFKIFFSLLTLQLLFCKKLVGREKIGIMKQLSMLQYLCFRILYSIHFTVCTLYNIHYISHKVVDCTYMYRLHNTEYTKRRWNVCRYVNMNFSETNSS